VDKKFADRMARASAWLERRQAKVTWWVLAFSVVATTTGFLLAFFVATPSQMTTTLDSGQGAIIGGNFITHLIDFGQKIFYFHVPVAITSFTVLFFTAYFGVRFLVTRERRFDAKARIATEVTLLFVVLTMITGVVWTRWAWGVWWVWEPRLTTYLILMLLVIGYFVLRASVEDEEKRAVYASVFGIIAFLDAMISLVITRVVPASSEAHPVVIGVPGGLDGRQLAAFLISMFGMMALGCVIYQLRAREERAKERLEMLKAALED
jgi:heme exporter protein C